MKTVKRLVSRVLRSVLATVLMKLPRIARWTGDEHFAWHAERVLEGAWCLGTRRRGPCPWAPTDDEETP